jgi:hypothetical protein
MSLMTFDLATFFEFQLAHGPPHEHVSVLQPDGNPVLPSNLATILDESKNKIHPTFRAERYMLILMRLRRALTCLYVLRPFTN